MQNAIHAWFQNSNKTSKKKKVIMEQFRDGLNGMAPGAYKRTAQEKILVTRRDFSANR